MIDLTLSEIAAAVTGELVAGDPEQLVSGAVTTDSREIVAGGIFFARRGENTDGFNFVDEALARGAALVVTERSHPQASAQIVVADATEALLRLSGYVLERVRALGRLKTVAITGSNGKTSTKNMLRTILATAGETVAPRASYNNEVGAPTTILEITEQTQYLVVELGAAGLGTIDRLASIVKPDISVELKVGLAHAGVFGGIETTTQIKAEMLPHTQTLAILNFDDSRVRAMRGTPGAEHLSWVSFGFSDDADYRLSAVKTSVDGTSFTLNYPDGDSREVRLRILGEHQAMNAAAALSVADQLGVDRQVGISALAELALAERWRMQPIWRKDGVLVINDAYNASPDSMRAALQTLATIARDGHRSIAVLGEMAELGEFAAEQHDALGRNVVRLNIDQLFVVGEGARLIHMGAVQEGSWDGESKFFATIDQALPEIRGKLTSGDVVLVKSSNSAQLRFLGDQLAEDAV